MWQLNCTFVPPRTVTVVWSNRSKVRGEWKSFQRCVENGNCIKTQSQLFTITILFARFFFSLSQRKCRKKRAKILYYCWYKREVLKLYLKNHIWKFTWSHSRAPDLLFIDFLTYFSWRKNMCNQYNCLYFTNNKTMKTSLGESCFIYFPH